MYVGGVMRILLISNMYPDDHYPSYGVFVKNQVDLLEAEGINIELQVMTKKNTRVSKILAYLKHYFLIFEKIIFGSHDIVYVHYASLNAIPILISRVFKRKKVWVNVHGSDVQSDGLIHEKINMLSGFLLKISDKVIVPTPYFKDVIIEKYEVPVESIFVSPSGGINRSIFYERKSAKRKGDTVYIGYVGRIEKSKGWEDLLHAFYQVLQSEKRRNVKLIMVGEGSDSSKRDQLLLDLNLEDKVILNDLLPQSELARVFNKMDLFIFPSKRESLGLVGLEAMACGTPVIGSEIGGIQSYLIDGYNGYFSQPGKPDSITTAINKFLDLELDRKEQLTKNALETAEKYDEEIVKKEFLSLLNQNK